MCLDRITQNNTVKISGWIHWEILIKKKFETSLKLAKWEKRCSSKSENLILDKVICRKCATKTMSMLKCSGVYCKCLLPYAYNRFFCFVCVLEETEVLIIYPQWGGLLLQRLFECSAGSLFCICCIWALLVLHGKRQLPVIAGQNYGVLWGKFPIIWTASHHGSWSLT